MVPRGMLFNTLRCQGIRTTEMSIYAMGTILVRTRRTTGMVMRQICQSCGNSSSPMSGASAAIQAILTGYYEQY